MGEAKSHLESVVILAQRPLLGAPAASPGDGGDRAVGTCLRWRHLCPVGAFRRQCARLLLYRRRHADPDDRFGLQPKLLGRRIDESLKLMVAATKEGN